MIPSTLMRRLGSLNKSIRYPVKHQAFIPLNIQICFVDNGTIHNDNSQ